MQKTNFVDCDHQYVILHTFGRRASELKDAGTRKVRFHMIGSITNGKLWNAVESYMRNKHKLDINKMDVAVRIMDLRKKSYSWINVQPNTVWTALLSINNTFWKDRNYMWRFGKNRIYKKDYISMFYLY